MKYLISLISIIIIIMCLYNIPLKKKKNIEPVNINKTHVCAIDSMILINYNGPKGQIVWKDSSRSYYCEVREVFYEINDPIKKKMIQHIFVQDFSNLKWGAYTNNWINAEIANYVIDSSKNGAMGVTYVPFKDINCAENFKKKYGGKIMLFKDIDRNIVTSSNELLKNRMNF